MKFSFTLIITVFIGSLHAQRQLTLQEVLQQALSSNYDVLLVKNDLQTATNNNNIGAAGYLPTISASADQLWSKTNTRQEFYSGQVNEKNGANNTSLTANLRLEWTLFDGFGMFIRDKGLQYREDFANMQLRAQMEMTVYQVTALYHTIAITEQMRQVYQGATELSQARFNQVNLKKEHGAANDFEWYQARLDRVADSSNLIRFEQNLVALKQDLGYLMGDSTFQNFTVIETPVNFTETSMDQYLTQTYNQNTDLMLQKATIAITDQDRKEIRSRYYPQLAFYAQTSFTKSESQVGLLQSNRSLGPGVGFTLRWTILDGLSNLTAMRNIKLQQTSNEIKVQQQQNLIHKEVVLAYNDLISAKMLYELEARNSMDANSIFQLAQNAFNNGSMTPIELRTFQYSVVEAQSRMLQAKLAYLTAQLNIQLLSGDFKRLF